MILSLQSQMSDSVAQLVEQRPFKAWVLGSNPSRVTKYFFKPLIIRGFFYSFHIMGAGNLDPDSSDLRIFVRMPTFPNRILYLSWSIF